MPKKSPKPIIYILILVVPLLFLISRPPAVKDARTKIASQAAWPIRIITWPFKEIKKLFTYRQTYREHQALQKKVGQLRQRMVGLEEVIRENNRYEKFLKFKRDLVFESVAASVVARDPTNWNASVLINKGSDDGIAPGMPVVNSLGVVGKVAEVTDDTAKVILITDPNFTVAAMVQQPRESGVLSGSLSGLCRIRYLPQDSKIKKSDVVITSKLSASFPEGLLIGQVLKVSTLPNSPTTECLVKPAVNVSEIEEVLVIKK